MWAGVPSRWVGTSRTEAVPSFTSKLGQPLALNVCVPVVHGEPEPTKCSFSPETVCASLFCLVPEEKKVHCLHAWTDMFQWVHGVGVPAVCIQEHCHASAMKVWTV